MCRTDYLLVNIYDAVSRLHAVLTIAKIVHSLKKDNPFHALLREKITRVAFFCRRTETATEHAVTANSHVQHSHIACCIICKEATREHICPSVLLVSCRTATVSNRVTEYCHCPTLVRSHHLQSQYVVPMICFCCSAEVCCVSLFQIRCGARAWMTRNTCRGCRAIVNRNGNILAWRHVECHSV